MASLFMSGEAVGDASSGEDSASYGDSTDPNEEGGDDKLLERQFHQAADHLQGMVHAASREQLLYLYARYKQVKVGKCNIPKPGFFDFEGKQKWEAWKALGDASPQQAMKEYVTTVRKLDPNWTPQAGEQKSGERKTAFGGPVVSSLYQEETIREEDKNIFDYCRENSIDRVTHAIRSKAIDVNVKDEEGRTLLHWACDRGHHELVSVLLQHKADINSQDNEGQTALHYASSCEFLDIVDILLKSGADPALRDQDGALPEEVSDCMEICSRLQQCKLVAAT
ncbi:acyl-CoA-binding domain-containing protein 6 [Ambystoma mexicanum]|uniref:acyl-CoA-binding domain-containing protein 6 n=1 Tax=Ambystoma mexicanum TaxID=8296 RepID=UPI0037E9B825